MRQSQIVSSSSHHINRKEIKPSQRQVDPSSLPKLDLFINSLSRYPYLLNTPKCPTWFIILNQQRHGLYLFVNLPATLEAGFTWFMLDFQKGIVGTPKVPLPASFFHSALAIESARPVHHWIPSPHEPTSHPPRNRLRVGAPTAEATETYLNTHSDIRLEQILRAPTLTRLATPITTLKF